MACTLEQKQANLCTSGIGKITDPIKLLQVTAQLLCDGETPVDPYDGLLVYTRQGLGTTTVVNPAGAYNLTFGANPVTEVHCHNCPLITGMTINNSAVLTLVDFLACPALSAWTMNNCDAIASINLSFIQTAGVIRFDGCAALASINITGLVTCTSLTVTGCPVVTMSLPNMTTSASEFFIYNNPSLTSIIAPLLATANGMSFQSNPLVTSYSFPSLISVSAGFVFFDSASLQTVSLPLLFICGNIFWGYDSPLLNSVSLPTANFIETIDLHNCPNLPVIDLPSLAGFAPATFNTTNDASLVVVNINGSAISDPAEFFLSNCGLNQASVDAILQAGIDGACTGGDILLDGGTSSVPSAAGLVNKGILIGNGVNVVTN